jgi:hypothetical protein
VKIPAKLNLLRKPISSYRSHVHNCHISLKLSRVIYIVGIFMICFHTKLHMPCFNSSLNIGIKPKDRYYSTVMMFYILKNLL